jgi:peroxiredoxin
MTIAMPNTIPTVEAPDFRLMNQENRAYNLAQVMGENGILLVFAGNIWDLGCIRNVLWLQRQTYKLSLHGINACVIVPNHTIDLSGFFMSIPRVIPFPMLADPDEQAYEDYDVQNTGFVMLDGDRQVRRVWHLSNGAVPQIRDVIGAVAK